MKTALINPVVKNLDPLRRYRIAPHEIPSNFRRYSDDPFVTLRLELAPFNRQHALMIGAQSLPEAPAESPLLSKTLQKAAMGAAAAANDIRL